jgi:hypothetical protein
MDGLTETETDALIEGDALVLLEGLRDTEELSETEGDKLIELDALTDGLTLIETLGEAEIEAESDPVETGATENIIISYASPVPAV